MNQNALEAQNSPTRYTLVEVCQHCRVHAGVLEELLAHRVVEWRGDDDFDQQQLQRLRKATRLQADLELNAAGTAVVLELLDDINRLRSELRRLRSLALDSPVLDVDQD